MKYGDRLHHRYNAIFTDQLAMQAIAGKMMLQMLRVLHARSVDRHGVKSEIPFSARGVVRRVLIADAQI
ncbi:MAG: hypothetical protein JOY90_39010 [Bradyrhizobium sp.]|uniref:hypothetical protein n=1 Tax=Bradyrhizobium sp. TaxID=376 RepID=UPI001E161AF5|nr:hypothetical protein [Bradyrhizobium sp.]MBV9566393.1 hypothetical protein [Bradyrhizobium sp.]